MNNTKFWLTAMAIAILSSLPSCNDDAPEANFNGTIMGQLEKTEKYHVESTSGRYEVTNGKFNIDNENLGSTETELTYFFLKNSKEDIVMMTRTLDNITGGLVIDAETTALSLVMMHPFFAVLPEKEYTQMSDFIMGLNNFPLLKNNVQSVIEANRDLLNPNNTQIAASLEKVFEELQGILDNNRYEDQSAEDSSRAFSGPEDIMIDCDPLDIKAKGNVVEMRVLGLSPSYKLQIGGPISEDDIEIPTRDDYGFVDLFTKTQSNWKYGETVSRQLTEDGEYRFSFKADLGDLFGHIISYAIDMFGGSKLLKSTLGVDVSKLTSFVYDRLTSYYASLSVAGVGDPTSIDWIGIAYDGICDFLEDNVTVNAGAATQAVAVVQTIAKATNIYFKAKTIGNFAGRLMGWFRADKEIKFNLCNYNENIVNCDFMEEQRLLYDFYQRANGDGWTNKTNWLSSKPFRYWHGIKTDEEGHVISIELPGNNLTGEAVFEESFHKLQHINIDNNPNLDLISLNNPNLVEVSINNSCKGLIKSNKTSILRLSDISSLKEVIGSDLSELYINNIHSDECEVSVSGELNKSYISDFKGSSITLHPNDVMKELEIKNSEVYEIDCNDGIESVDISETTASGLSISDRSGCVNITDCVFNYSIDFFSKEAYIHGTKIKRYAPRVSEYLELKDCEINQAHFAYFFDQPSTISVSNTWMCASQYSFAPWPTNISTTYTSGVFNFECIGTELKEKVLNTIGHRHSEGEYCTRE